METSMEFKMKAVMADLEINGVRNGIIILEAALSHEGDLKKYIESCLKESKRFLAELQEDYTPEMAASANEILSHRVNDTLGAYLGE